jgi:alkylated DNA repair dioxygenase AlkB
VTDSAQPSPSSLEPRDFDPTFAGLARIALDEACWVEVVPGWVRGAQALFERLLHTLPWAQRTRWMYERRVLEPRLTAAWSLAEGAPLEPPLLEAIRLRLCARYGVVFDSVGFNLYRDGKVSFAWHGDRIEKEIEQPVVALLSLGAPRRFLLRPKGGGKSRRFELGRGDLLVTGGRTQRA